MTLPLVLGNIMEINATGIEVEKTTIRWFELAVPVVVPLISVMVSLWVAKAVYEERFMKLLAFMTGRPSFDQRAIDEEFVRLYRLNPDVLQPAQVPADAAGGPPEAELAAAAEQVGATPSDLGQAAGQAAPGSQLPGQAGNISDQAVAAARPVSRPPSME